MVNRIEPIGPQSPNVAQQTALSPSLRAEAAVKAQVELLGGANNYAAQSVVQKRQDAETNKQTKHLIDRKIVTATLAALAPVASAHDEDEADKERSHNAFGSDLPFGYASKKKRPRK